MVLKLTHYVRNLALYSNKYSLFDKHYVKESVFFQHITNLPIFKEYKEVI